MKKIVLFLGLFAIASILLIFSTASADVHPKALVKTVTPGFALIELFTSQGCSSCPAADKLLGTYAVENNAQIIPIAFHVDYWNRLGWHDPFSSANFSDRQRRYAASFGNETVYTPQAVINGSSELVGSDAQKLSGAIGKAIAQQPAATITIGTAAVNNSKISCTYTLSGAYSGATLNAALVQRKVTTAVKAGENDGALLTNYNVVRDFTSMAVVQNSGNIVLTIPNDAKTTAFSMVLYLQQDDNRKIIAATKKDI